MSQQGHILFVNLAPDATVLWDQDNFIFDPLKKNLNKICLASIMTDIGMVTTLRSIFRKSDTKYICQKM